jgi:hypothetical protein
MNNKVVVAAAAGIALTGGLVWAQSGQISPPPGGAQSAPPTFLEFDHGPPYPGAPMAPAGTLKDVPLHPAEASGRVPKLNHVLAGGSVVHMMPTVQGHGARVAAGLAPKHEHDGHAGNVNQFAGPLLYHAGGQVMLPFVAAYNIYWDPSTLQDGSATGYSANYGTPTVLASAWLPAHGLFNIATQYFQTISGTTTYINNGGGLGGFVVPTTAYPAHDATACGTQVNCVSDAQMRTQIQAVMSTQGWTGGLNKIFVLFTSSGEITCFNSSNCSFGGSPFTYCAYHSSFTFGGQPVIYAIIPYGQSAGCQEPGQTTPNDPNGDLAANVQTHEITEAATDPFGTAWFDASANEIGDLCNFNFGTNTWGSGTGAGNQMWNGVIFEVQQEFDNHSGTTGTCRQSGPD